MDISMEFGKLVVSLENDSLKKALKKLDKKMLAKSLKTIDPKISEKIFNNMTGDEADELKMNISTLGTIKLDEVESAQKEIIGIVKKAMSTS
jgi:flagellar motor switch protein FliG